MEKKKYVPPVLEVFEFEVERGFANSMSKDMNQFIGDTKNESILKGDEELVLSYDLGEKENGDPLDITSAVVAQDCIILESK